MRIEKALFSNSPGDLSYYDRLYFGNEFCENNLLNVSEVKKLLKVKIEKTFVTPYLSDRGLSKVKELLDLLPSGMEVVFNDWGVLELLGRFKPVLGRVLNKQKRGPRIVDMKLSNKQMRYFQGSNVDSIEKFLIGQNVGRVEFCNILQGIKTGIKLKKTIYYPFVYVSTTRLCFLNGIEDLGRKKLSISPCKKECSKYLLENKKFPVKMILKGNTQFYENKSVPKKFDRIVHMPKLIV